jgi:hypothetical protein
MIDTGNIGHKTQREATGNIGHKTQIDTDNIWTKDTER